MSLIAVSAQGREPGSPFETRFGRCAYFITFDTDAGTYGALPNPAQFNAGGAGPRSAQLLKQNKVSVVITGRVGPHAQTALQAAGIEVIEVVEVDSSLSGLSAREILMHYAAGDEPW